MTTPVRDLALSVLAAVQRLGDDAYGAAICRDLSERGGRSLAVGAVITSLHRLERKGLLRSALSDPRPVRGGRARRCFRLTAGGRRALAAAVTERQRLWDLPISAPGAT